MQANWHNAVAHIDADGFYASCEAVRHPELKGRPICVLSNQNAFVVAKNYDAKALGIKTIMSVHDAKRLAPHAAYLPPDFRFYGQISAKMFSILRRYNPQIEVYSIDECFMDMNGIRTLWRKSYNQIADDIRESVKREIGITVSVGISTTKTLAKIASESNKPDGTTIVPGKRIDRFLADIPGIGHSRAALLCKFNIRTAQDFANTKQSRVKRLLGRLGLTLWHEVNGQSVLPLEMKPPLPKSMARAASMGEITTDRTTIAAHLSRHTLRLVSELVAKKLLARRIRVFLTCKSFEAASVEIHLDFSTNSLKKVSAAVKQAFLALYREGEAYRGCGIVATHISRQESATEDLFGLMHEDIRQQKLMLAVNRINKRHGNHTVAPAAAKLMQNPYSRPSHFQYPVFWRADLIWNKKASEAFCRSYENTGQNYF